MIGTQLPEVATSEGGRRPLFQDHTGGGLLDASWSYKVAHREVDLRGRSLLNCLGLLPRVRLIYLVLAALAAPSSTVCATSFSFTSSAWMTTRSPTLMSVFWIG